MTILLLVCVLALAWCNGANDVSKGIATLVASGVATERRALSWGTAWTVAGALASAWVATGLIKTFSGAGLISSIPTDSAFYLCISLGAFGWVAFATRFGLPVSTTHAITGALVGAGLVAVGVENLSWSVLLSRFALPLVCSPLLAMLGIWLTWPIIHSSLRRLDGWCVCLTHESCAGSLNDVMAMTTTAPAVCVGTTSECKSSQATLAGIRFTDALHWLSAGATSFARGMNDTPKILALGLATASMLNISIGIACAFVALAMGGGSWLQGSRVTETLAHRVTRMSPQEGFATSLVTSFLVVVASRFGLPVSTTHVSGGAIIGLGIRKDVREVGWRTVREMLLAWLVTLPFAASLAALPYWIFHRFS